MLSHSTSLCLKAVIFLVRNKSGLDLEVFGKVSLMTDYGVLGYSQQ